MKNKYDVKCRLQKKEAQLKTQKDLLNIDKQDLLLNTDFKAKGITNQAGRNAYVDKNSAIMERKEKIEKKQADVDKLRLDYEWACDELENYKLLIRLEISRRQAGNELTLADPMHYWDTAALMKGPSDSVGQTCPNGEPSDWNKGPVFHGNLKIKPSNQELGTKFNLKQAEKKGGE